MHRHILILLACVSAYVTAAGNACLAVEANPEQFTLADGRILVGTYDAAKGVLTLTGKIKGAVPVKAEDIVHRKPAPAEPEVAKDDTEEKAADKPKRAAAPPPDPKQQLIEQQRTWINRKTTEFKSYDTKLERTRRKIIEFRKQFAERAKAEGQWYDPERSPIHFLEEQTVTLPRSQANNSAVRGLVDEYKNLEAKQKELGVELTNARKALAELEGTVPPTK